MRSMSIMSKSEPRPRIRTRWLRRWRQDLMQFKRHSPPSSTRITGEAGA